jgi:hypothetical protein
MVVSIIIGIVILAIIIFTVIRVVKNVLIGLALICLVLALSYLVLGSLPNLRNIPIIGPRLPRVPSTMGELITLIKKFFYNLKILEVSRDSQNRLLIVVQNTGKFSVSNFSVYVDDKPVRIVNEPTDPLESGKTTAIQTDWEEAFMKILVRTSRVNATYYIR